MTGRFIPRLDILPLPQRRLWDEMSAVPGEFVLYGGAAIALHLGHRQSVDFDFFGNTPLDPAKRVPAVSFLAGVRVTQREPNRFGCTVDRLARLPQAVRDRLAKAAREVDLDRLPTIAAEGKQRLTHRFCL